jgi:hypothetical protein
MSETYKDKIMKPKNSSIEINKFIEYLGILDTFEYKNDAQKFVNSIISSTNDDAQLSTIRIILNNKISDRIIKQTNNCPHCNKKNNINPNDDYMICGYTSKGFDWNGCGKDWCYACSKKLCKQWGTDILYNKYNRVHNGKCCRKHANKNGEDYLMTYCQCHDKHYKVCGIVI